MTEADDAESAAELTGPILVAERIHRSLGAQIVDGLWTWLVMSTILTVVLSSMFIALVLVYSLIEPAKLAPLLGTTVLFVAFTFAFISVVGFPLGLFSALGDHRPRSIAGTADTIRLVYAHREVSLPVSCCTFRVGTRWSMDRGGAIFRRDPFLVITCIPSAKARPEEISLFFCGLDPKSLEDWKAYLSAVSIGPDRAHVSFVMGLVTGFLIGLVGGVVVSQFVSVFGGGITLAAASALLVAVDGAVAGSLFAYVRTADIRGLQSAQFESKGVTALYALSAAALAVVISSRISLWTSIIFATVNAAFGAGLGIVLASCARSRLRSDSLPGDSPED